MTMIIIFVGLFSFSSILFYNISIPDLLLYDIYRCLSIVIHIHDVCVSNDEPKKLMEKKKNILLNEYDSVVFENIYGKCSTDF